MRYSKIRDLREDNDLTQQEVAKKLKVNRSTYTMWELGDVNFPIEKLALLANLLHTNIDYMLELSYDKQTMKYPEDISIEYIGYRLRKVRLKLKKRQTEFAKILGIHQSSYSYYEDGKIRIPTKKLIILSQTFHISINTICNGKPVQQDENAIKWR